MPHEFVGLLPETKESQAAIAKVRAWTYQYLLNDETDGTADRGPTTS